MSRTLLNLVVVSLTMICLNGPLIHAKSTWVRASTDEVIVISDAPQKAVTEYVVKYSAFRQAFINLLTPTGRRPPPMVLLLFANQAELKSHLADSKDNLIAFSTEIDRTALTALANSGDPEGDLATAFEFDTICSLQRVGYFLPLWMTQGTGEVMSTLRIKNGQCIIDANRSQSDSVWRDLRVLPWKHFFEFYQSAPEYKGPKAEGMYQAQAWATMTAILFKEKTPREQFARLAGKFPTEEGIQAVSEMLGVPEDKFTETVQRQLIHNTVVAIPYDEKTILADIKIRPAEQCEVMAYRGEVLIASGRIAEGNQLIDEARILSPNAVESNEARARRSLREKDQSAAARYYRLAIEAGSANVNALLTSAAEYLDVTADFPNPVMDGPKDTVTALAQIHRAMELDPGNARARRLMGRAYFIAEKPSEEGLAELSEALTDDATGLQLRYYRGLLYNRIGRKTDALADFDQIVRNPTTPGFLLTQVKGSRMPLLFEADQKTLDQMLADQKFDQARALMDQRIIETEKTPAEGAYRKMRAWVDETELWTQAVSLYNAKDMTGALNAARKFTLDFPNSIRIKEAKRMVAGVELILKKRSDREKTP